MLATPAKYVFTDGKPIRYEIVKAELFSHLAADVFFFECPGIL